MPIVGLQALHRVDRTFAQGLNAGRGSSEGVEKGQLDQVPAASARFDEAACLAHVNRHVRSLVNTAREAGELSSYQVDQVGVELHRIDVAYLMIESAKHIRAAARSEHQRARSLQEVVGQC